MAVNHYFQGGDGIGTDAEKRLHENLIIENLKIYGHAVYYLPRTLVNRDLILGEDSASRFDDSYLIEMYFVVFIVYVIWDKIVSISCMHS